MLIQCLGHSKFLLTLQSGYRIVTDPFDASTGYPVGDTEADAVLVSHHHSDHDAVDTVKGYTVVIDSEGVHTLNPQIRVRSLACFHDDQKGALRGNNLIHCIEAEGMSVVHLGDLGCALSKEQAAILNQPDVLMIPVGGFGMPEEVAALVGFLVSEDAAYITGEVININGGLYT